MEKRNANNKKMIFRLILIISVFCTLFCQGCNESDESAAVRKPMIIRKKINPVASINEKQVNLTKNDNIKNNLKNSQKQITQANNTKENFNSTKRTENSDNAVNKNDNKDVNNDFNTQKIDNNVTTQNALADNKEIENKTRQNEIVENKSNNETESNSKQNESDKQKQLEKNDKKITQQNSLDHKKINLASLSLDKFNHENLKQSKNVKDEDDNIKKIDDKILLNNKKNLKQENQKKDISNNIKNTIIAKTDKEHSKNNNDLSKSLQIKYYYNPKGKIDPFKPLISKKKKDTSPDPIKEQKKKQLTRKRYLTQLEKFDISQLKLTAVIMTKKGGKGIVEEASGRGYVVKTGTYIGLNNGKVSDIFLDRIIIKEPEQGFAGSVKYNTKVMKLHKPDGEF